MFEYDPLFNEEGAPLKCQMCGTDSSEFVINNDYMDYTVMEMEVVCPTCNCICGHWVTGNWDPCFEFGELE